jgi:hypothetical protein
MQNRQQTPISRVHLLRMARQVQRAVDYAIKAYESGSSQPSQMVLDTEQEWCKLRLEIGARGGARWPKGRLADAKSAGVRFSFRVFGALQSTYYAASEIAQSSLLLKSGRKARVSATQSPERLANGLVRLYTVALFNEEILYADMILKAREDQQRLGPQSDHTTSALVEGSANIEPELAITKCVAQIIEQAYEIAEAITEYLLDETLCSSHSIRKGMHLAQSFQKGFVKTPSHRCARKLESTLYKAIMSGNYCRVRQREI